MTAGNDLPVFIVTGGSRGIGAAIAAEAAAAGYQVLLTYAGRADLAEAVVDDIHARGGQATAIQADTARAEDIRRLFAVADDLGRLAVLVYNGGIVGPSSGLLDATDETLASVIDVNLTGALICSREAIRRMATTLGGQGGSIVLISSRAALYGAPGEHVWYAASKGGIDSLTMGLAREVGAMGIRVNAVSPGPIATDIHVPGKLERIAAGLPMQRVGQPSEVSAAVMFLVSDAASYVAGANITVAGAR
ncbi:SDR family oxidoreductase [Sphingomonas sp. ZT3P38]|uniref:SDR family oxidoreductase n=1 Tax=Parasphingomonas zepuensis TaxID=3096161 RepID=UPI002FC58702